MPDLLREILEENARENQPNRFFPEGGGTISNILGLLDLVVGAPTRAVQGAIISGRREESPILGGLKSFAGFSLDTGQFGRGEVASGLEMLEEMGFVKEKDDLGNIIGSIGVDMTMDLFTLNVAGAAAKVALKPGALATGRLIKAADVRYASPVLNIARRTIGRPTKKDYLRLTQKATAAEKRTVFHNLFRTEKGRQGFARELVRIGFDPLDPTAVYRKAARETRRLGGLILREKALGRVVYRKFNHLQKFGVSKEQQKILERLTRASTKLDELIESYHFERLQLKMITPSRPLQTGLFRPTQELMGHAVKGFREQAIESIVGRHVFKVADFALSSKHMGTNNAASFFDITFRDAPRFLRDRIPANMSRTGLLVDIEEKFTPSVVSRIAEVIPPFMNPFDFRDTLRRTGLFNRLAPAWMNHWESLARDRKKLFELAKKINLKEGTQKDQILAKIADGKIGRDEALLKNLVTKDELAVLDEWDLYAKGMARRKYKEARTGLVRPLLPDKYFHPGPYLHHIPTNRQQQVFRDFVVVTGKDRGISREANMLGDIPKRIYAAPLEKRLASDPKIQYLWSESAKAYVMALNRKQYLEPALTEMLPTIARLNQPGSTQLYRTAQSLVQQFFGGYSDIDGMFDDLARIVGVETKHLATKMSAAVTLTGYRAMLGLNPRTTLLQFHQGILNNSLHLGMMDTLKGLVKYVTRADGTSQAVYKKSGINTQMMEHFAGDLNGMYGIQAAKGKFFDTLDKILFGPLQAFDNFNRGWAWHTATSVAKRSGLSDQQAWLHGLSAANETQFIYGRLGASSARNTPIGRILLQYQSFATKQLAFLARSFRRDPGTMFMRYVAMSGIIARNVGQYVDLSRELAPTTPGDVQNILTMDRIPGLLALEALYDYSKAMLQEAAGTPKSEHVIDPEYARENLARTFWQTVVPAGTMFNRFAKYQPTLEAATEEEQTLPVQIAREAGRIVGAPFGGLGEGEAQVAGLRTGGVRKELDRWGRNIRELSPEEAALGMIGFKTSQARIDREVVESIRFMDAWIQRRYERMMTEAVRAIENGRDPSPFILRAGQIAHKQRFAVLQALRMRLKNRQLSLRERRLKRSTRPVKEQFSP